MHFAFLGKQVLLICMTFLACEGFLSLFPCLFIQGIFINEQTVKLNLLLKFSA